MAAASKKQLQYFVVLICFTHILCVIDSYKHPWYSTKTPYFWLHDEETDIPEDSEMWLDFEQSTCQAIHLNAVFRHGARFPGIKWIRRMTELHKKLLKVEGNAEKYPFLKSWTNPFPELSEKLLADLGEDEHFVLGTRFGKRFSLLLEEEMGNIKYIVTSKQRTLESARYFHEGLTSIIPTDKNEKMEHTVDDISLRFHDNCDKFKESVDKNDTAMAEYHKFKKGPEVTKVGQEMGEKLGVTISPNEINTIYQLCAFEEAITDRDSGWCQFLNEENLPVIEYMSDLKQYWKKAYGYNITAAMSCPLLSGLFAGLQEVIDKNEKGEDHTVAILQFGHAETLAPFYSALGLYKDDPQLKADNFKEHANRKFQSSKILLFSGNIAFVLYECDAGEDGEGSDDDNPFTYLVKVFVNEEEIEIPACNETVCEYEKFREFYKHYADHCDFFGLCRVEGKSQHDEL